MLPNSLTALSHPIVESRVSSQVQPPGFGFSSIRDRPSQTAYTNAKILHRALVCHYSCRWLKSRFLRQSIYFETAFALPSEVSNRRWQVLFWQCARLIGVCRVGVFGFFATLQSSITLRCSLKRKQQSLFSASPHNGTKRRDPKVLHWLLPHRTHE